MAACFLYNAWVIPFRYIFCEYQTNQNYHIWFIIDYLVVDLLYIVDILVFKYRLLYMENGFWVKVWKFMEYFVSNIIHTNISGQSQVEESLFEKW